MRLAPLGLCWVGVVILGCSSTAPEDPSEPPPSASAEASSPSYYSVEDLRGLGLLTRALDGDKTLVCGPEAGSGCICLEPLPCEAAGDCIKFDENVAAFRSAVAQGQDGRSVQCDRAEIGRCGDFRYFDFQGDLERREMRWFDETGVLVGQREVTDYQAYCEGGARARFMGRLPRCMEMSEPELICGEAPSPLMAPLDDLRRFTAGPLQPGAAAQP